MSTQETTAVHIVSNEDVESLEARLPQLKDERVLITVSEESSALLTAAEFHRLMSHAKEANVQLTISTEDRLRRDLARMLGWIVIDTSSGSGSRGNTVDLPSRSGDTEDIIGAWTRLNTTADLATYRPPPANGSTRDQKPDDPSLPGTIVVDSAEVAQKLLEARPPAGVAANGNGYRPSHPEPEPAAEQEVERGRRFRLPRRRVLVLAAAIIAPLVVLAMVGAILAFILPTATITLVPVEKEINADLTYGVASPGNTFDLTIQPVQVSHETTFDKTIPTTGERFVPDGTAGGSVLLTNPSVEAVAVPGGTALVGKNGVKYLTQKDVTVPAADPFGSLSFGSVTVAVAAASPGEGGNTGAGTIVGQLDSGIFYNNKDAIAGGTMKRIAVVSQADLDALRQAAQTDLAGRAEQEFQASVDKSLQLVPNSETKTDPTFQFSLAAGQDGTDVSVHAAQTIAAQAFDPGKLNAMAKDEAARQLAAKAGPNEIILGDTVKIGDPVSQSEGTSFTRHATARTRVVISPDEQSALEKQIVGKSKDNAIAAIQSMHDVASYQIAIKPDWLPQRMPELNSHIKIVVANSDGTSASP